MFIVMPRADHQDIGLNIWAVDGKTHLSTTFYLPKEEARALAKQIIKAADDMPYVGSWADLGVDT